MKAMKGLEVAEQLIRNLEAFEDIICIHKEARQEIRETLGNKVVVPEEIWLKLEEETKRLVNKIEALQLSIQSIYNPRIKILEDKQEKLRMLIENLDFTEANGRYGKVYLKDDSLFSIWLEELRRLIQE